jgi:hypothetical protein
MLAKLFGDQASDEWTSGRKYTNPGGKKGVLPADFLVSELRLPKYKRTLRIGYFSTLRLCLNTNSCSKRSGDNSGRGDGSCGTCGGGNGVDVSSGNDNNIDDCNGNGNGDSSQQ